MLGQIGLRGSRADIIQFINAIVANVLCLIWLLGFAFHFNLWSRVRLYVTALYYWETESWTWVGIVADNGFVVCSAVYFPGTSWCMIDIVTALGSNTVTGPHTQYVQEETYLIDLHSSVKFNCWDLFAWMAGQFTWKETSIVQVLSGKTTTAWVVVQSSDLRGEWKI